MYCFPAAILYAVTVQKHTTDSLSEFLCFPENLVMNHLVDVLQDVLKNRH